MGEISVSFRFFRFFSPFCDFLIQCAAGAVFFCHLFFPFSSSPLHISFPSVCVFFFLASSARLKTIASLSSALAISLAMSNPRRARRGRGLDWPPMSSFPLPLLSPQICEVLVTQRPAEAPALFRFFFFPGGKDKSPRSQNATGEPSSSISRIRREMVQKVTAAIAFLFLPGPFSSESQERR